MAGLEKSPTSRRRESRTEKTLSGSSQLKGNLLPLTALKMEDTQAEKEGRAETGSPWLNANRTREKTF